jgi:hypothetical protein
MITATRRIAFALVLMGLLADRAPASSVTFTATDVGVGPGAAHPLSSAAAASFDAAAAALGPVSLITFESAPVGNFASLAVAPGVTLTGADETGAQLFINNVPSSPSIPALNGFNTTPGGANYLEMQGGNATFTFASPTQFFGAYFTGVQPAFFNSFLAFSDGSTQMVSIPNPSQTAGGITFVGFTDAGKSISSVTVIASMPMPGTGADFIGVDDVRYQTTAVPEPSSLTLSGVAGLIGLACALRRRAATV